MSDRGSASDQKNFALPEFGFSDGGGVAPVHSAATPSALQRPAGGKDVVPVKFSGASDARTTTTVSDGGGRKLFGARVNLIFWGDGWNNASNPSLNEVVQAFASIMHGPYAQGIMQYGAFCLGLAGLYRVTASSPPDTFGDADIAMLVTRLMLEGVLQEPDEYAWNLPQLHVVIPGPNKVYNNRSVNGRHSFTYALDFDWFGLDWFNRAALAWVQYGTLDSMTSTFSHELVEACTDPEGDGLQVNPRGSSDWNEIGDVCSSTGRLNGVLVQSYWSQADRACIIPMDVPVTRQITHIRKHPRIDARHPIRFVGGITVFNNQPFLMSQQQCINEIDGGYSFFVEGTDGSRAPVQVYTHFPPWSPRGSRYIATVPDESTADNLLSLPELPPIYDAANRRNL